MGNIYVKMILLFLISCFVTTAYSKTLSENDYNIKQLKVKDGLSQSSILSIVQDRIGFMWFGTGSGLNKYDGYTFKVYLNDPNDSLTISDNVISTLFEDKNGNLWVGTAGGYLNKFDRKTDGFIKYNLNQLANHSASFDEHYYEYPLLYSRNNDISVTSISEDKEGRIWVGTWGCGVFIFDGKNQKIFNLKSSPSSSEGLSYNRVTKILSTKKGDMWIATFGGGLNKLISLDIDEKGTISAKFVQYKKSCSSGNCISDNKVTTLFEDNNQNIYIGTYYGGLNILRSEMKNVPANKAKFECYNKYINNMGNLTSYSIMAVTEDDSGEIWIGTFGGGLNRFDPQTKSFRFFRHDFYYRNMTIDNDIISIYKDKSGIIWVGTHLGEGLSILEPKNIKFGLINANQGMGIGLNDDVVWSIHKSKSNKIWVGTYRGGLNELDRQKNYIKIYKNDPNNLNSLSNNHVRSIAEDDFGRLWIGTYSGGLNMLNLSTGKFNRFLASKSDSNSIGGNQIQKIYIDSSSIMWLAIFGGGLNSLDLKKNIIENPKFTKYKHNPNDSTSLSDDRAYTVYEDRNKDLWVGTFGGGINKFNKRTQSFERFVNNPIDPKSLQNDKVLCLYEDVLRNFWVGTYGSGLIKFDRNLKQFIQYGSQNGIDADVVYGILEDDNFNLWLSTSNGIYKHNYRSKNTIHFDVQDGVQSLEFNGGAYLKSADGELFFGGINGFNYFYPNKIITQHYVPPIAITLIKAANKLIKGELDTLTLSYDQNFVSFEFAGLGYSDQQNQRYSYLLDGFDTEWKFTDAKFRMAAYTNLPPGDYIFRVKCANHDGVWGQQEATAVISISPPLWQRWWFIITSLLIISAGIYYLGSTQYRNELRIEKLKTRLAADLHDNIGSGLTEISILSEIAQNDIEAGDNTLIRSRLKNISELARQLVDNMSDIVWVVNPKRDSLKDLLIRLKDSYSDILSSYGISFRIMDLEKLDNLSLSMEYRQNLYLIFKEAINNAVKHSKCKKITLQANTHGSLLELTLVDDGKGCEALNYEQGNGIKNMKNRSSYIGGKLEWNSLPNVGTTVKFIGDSQKLIAFSKKSTFS